MPDAMYLDFLIFVSDFSPSDTLYQLLKSSSTTSLQFQILLLIHRLNPLSSPHGQPLLSLNSLSALFSSPLVMISWDLNSPLPVDLRERERERRCASSSVRSRKGAAQGWGSYNSSCPSPTSVLWIYLEFLGMLYADQIHKQLLGIQESIYSLP